MATDLTQDAVLRFLQSRGGSVRNSDLLLHFSPFVRDHADRVQNRELFKKFVNSVATVKQAGGVSHVVLRKRFRGHVSGGGAEGGSSGSQWVPVGRSAEPPAGKATLVPAVRTEKPKEGTTPAPPGHTAKKTILPAAGLVQNNNNNVEQQQQQVNSSPGPSGRPAQVVGQIPELKTPSLSKPPAPPDPCSTVGQPRVGPGPGPGPGPLPGVTHVPPAVRHHRETSQQVPEPPRGGEARVQLQGGPPPQAHIAPRRTRHRKSYKTAVSCDEDEEDEEEVSIRPLSTPPDDMGRAISASSPFIKGTPSPPSAVSSSSSSSSERVLPKIYVQDMEMEAPRDPGRSSETGVRPRGQLAGTGLDPGESMSTRRSLPPEAERHMASPHAATEATPHHSIHQEDHRSSQPAGVQLESRHGSNQSQRPGLSSSHGHIFSSNDRSPPGPPRASGWNSSPEGVRARAGGLSPVTTGQTVDLPKVQDVLQRAQGTKLESAAHPADSKTTVPWRRSDVHLCDNQEPAARLSPLHRSTDHLHDNQLSVARVMPWHLSTGDLYDDEAESSDGSMTSPQMRQRPSDAKRLSSRLRSRMCRSMGADLDQLLQEEAGGTGGGGNDAARLSRLHRISSSLSLHYNLSSSSLSSCSTPPRSHSFANLVEVERRGEKRDLPPGSPSSASTPPPHHEGRCRQSQVPLEPREHAWLVKGAAGAWPDIYSLFREDSSLLNRQDFISGFTVLHWIAKHGDHRVLNTLWYGVEKAGLTFDVDARATSGQTALHIAAIHGNKNIMRLLVNKFKANVRLRDTAGKRPWQYLSCTAPLDVFQMLGAPARVALTGERGGGRVDSSWEQQQHQQHQRRRRRRHYFSTASGQRPLTVAGTTKVKRSSSIAAFLKHKSLHRFYGQQADSPL